MKSLLDDKTILLVEDEFLIAACAVDMLKRLGAVVVRTAHRLEDGLALATEERFDAAVLDVNLDGQRSLPIAARLREREVPYVFATGYSRSDLGLSDEVMLLDKPYTSAKLSEALQRVLSDTK